ncbi:MAG TPA: hypothetical protein VFA70_00685 [Dehalococcoidia bacterium]|nr:hypothetical protein [Dehalococcoidia bacterium]
MTRFSQLALVDLDTGEAHRVVPLERRRYAYPSGRYMTVGVEVAELVVYDLTKIDIDVFLLLLTTHATGEFRKVVVAHVASELETYPSNVSKALARLVAIVALLKGPKDGRSYSYMINPYLAFCGPGEQHQQVYRRYAKPLATPEQGDTGSRRRRTAKGQQ